MYGVISRHFAIYFLNPGPAPPRERCIYEEETKAINTFFSASISLTDVKLGHKLMKAKPATTRRKKKPLPPDILWKKKSRFQNIEFIKDRRGLLLKLNGWPQVHSREEARYHENVATLPLMLAQRVKRCVILGGGDGLAARNILRFRGVKKLTLVELDAGVIELCSQQPDFVRMNEDVLHNRRLKLIVGDAIEWFLKSKGPFDIIINDIEVMFTRQPKKMTLQRHFQLFQTMAAKLAPGGVAVVTVPDDFDEPLPEDILDAFEGR